MTPNFVSGLTRAGIGNAGPLKSFVGLASRYGFGAVDASAAEAQAWIAEEGLDAVKAWLSEQNIVLGCFALSIDWSHEDAAFQAGLETLVREAAVARDVGCTRFMTWAMPSTNASVAPYTAVTVRRLRLISRLLGEFGLRLGIEYIGPHHLRYREKNPFLWDLPSALDWIDAIGEPNTGVVLDTFHWHCSEGSLDEIRALDGARIVHVHINDAGPGLVEALVDNDRLFPGEGVIGVAAFLEALQSTGYSGIVAQEVLTPQPLTDDAETLAARAQANFRNLLA